MPASKSVLLAVAIVVGWPQTTDAAESYSFHHENVLGTSLELHVDADGAQAARRAEAVVLAEIDRLATISSTYDPGSEVSGFLRASSATPYPVSPELAELLGACEFWRETTDGAFHPGVEAVTRIWKASAARGSAPTAAELAAIVDRLAGPSWELDPAQRTAVRLDNLPFSLNAVAKGFIVDRAALAATERVEGVTGLVLSIGGDLRACGRARQLVGIADPRSPALNAPPIEVVELQDRALATSGHYERGFEIGGVRYSHVIDPRSGRPVATNVHSASVIAREAAQADALATILLVLPPDEGVELVRGFADTECSLVLDDGELVASPGWSGFLVSADGDGKDSAKDDSAKDDSAKDDSAKVKKPAPKEIVLCDEKTPIRVLVPQDSSLGRKWTKLVFDDAPWKLARNGVGYDEDSDYDKLIKLDIGKGKRKDEYPVGVYVRIPFEVEKPAALNSLLLDVRYDDGFVAYLNGKEVARANAPDEVRWNSKSAGNCRDSDAVRFEEFDLDAHLDLLKAGRNVLAVHGLNASAKSSDMLLWSELRAGVGRRIRIDPSVTWEKDFALDVAFELDRPGGRRYLRPYVAVWVEDSKGKAVRTLCLWIQKQKWLRDLRRWSRQGGRDRSLIRSIARATRRPGKYKLTWDGKTNDGKPVPMGPYTVMIEIVREHGTYQLMRKKVRLGSEPERWKLEGNVEIKSASLDYRKKARKL